MYNRKYWLTLLLSTLCFCGIANAEQSTLYYILDASGSMWGRVEGKIKIQVAKDILAELITEMPAGVDSGLTVYGHRKKGDCTDIEELVPPGIVDKALIKSTINRISPKGKTPLADSIQKTVKALKDREGELTLVLVSDGIETCNQDPCKLTETLRASGIKFVMHVVGFGVGDAASKQLACIADAAGGRYLAAATASELLASLTKVKESVVEKKAVPLPTATTIPASTFTPITQKISGSSKSIKIQAKGPGRVKIVHDGWLKAPRYWKLLDPETGVERARFSGMSEQLVGAGLYQLAWRQIEHGSTEVMLGEVISVASGKTTEVSAKTGIQLELPTWVKQPRAWGLRYPGTEEVLVSYSQLQPQLIPSGNYDLFWKQSEHGAKLVVLKNIDIKPDVLNVVPITTALNLVAADWVPKQFNFWNLVNLEDRSVVASFSDSFGPHLAPPGKYGLVYRQSEHGATNSDLGEVEVVDGVLTEYPLNTGVKIIPQASTPAPYFIEFVAPNGDGSEGVTVRVKGSFNPMLLKPGHYKINYRQSEHGSSTVTLVDSFEIPAGNLVEIEM
ncbi:VWA domain-containing protein [Oligoflexia bacterium]|nr:VWA domain-containing protein [Oligoflexia bacterium]